MSYDSWLDKDNPYNKEVELEIKEETDITGKGYVCDNGMCKNPAIKQVKIGMVKYPTTGHVFCVCENCKDDVWEMYDRACLGEER